MAGRGKYDSQIAELNPWWGDPATVATDPHIAGLASSPFQWDPPALNAIPLEPGGVHTLRGPRQVGKTTTVKRLVARLVRRGERRAFYFSFDLERDQRAIREVVVRAKRIHPDPRGPWYLFLDEITSVPDWQLGIKYLWDAGIIRDDFVLCTGSSARKLGAEQLPGRRGKGRDFLHLPMSFRDYCRRVVGLTLPDETVTAGGWLGPAGRSLAATLNLQGAALADAVESYQRVGGFPAAVRDSMREGDVTPATLQMLWQIIAGDIQDAGRDKHSALKLLERVGISLGAPLAWATLQQDMDAGSQNTAKAYTHLLSEAFILLTVFHWKQGGGFEPGRQRKLYFVDPVLARLAPTLIQGGRRPDEDGLLENLIASALYASAAEHLALADPLPGAIGYWKSSGDRETDFVAPAPELGAANARVPVEVKGDADGRITAARRSIRQSFKRGVIVSRTQFDWDEDIPTLPVGVYLAGLADRPERVLEL